MRKLLFLTSAILLVFGGLLLWANRKFLSLRKDTFGIDYNAKSIFSFDTERDFHGDGYAIKAENIDPRSRQFFSDLPAAFFSRYPMRHPHLGDYQVFKWRRTPVLTSDTFRTNYALEAGTIEDQGYVLTAEAQAYQEQARKLLSTPGNYYAMFFRDHPYGYLGIDLFIVDPGKGAIFKVNRQ